MTYGTMTKILPSSLCAEREQLVMRSFALIALLALGAGVQTPTSTQSISTSPETKTIADSKTPVSTSAPVSPAKSDLASSDPVITLHGLCAGSQSGKPAA